MPALERPVEGGGLGIAQQIRHLTRRKSDVREILIGRLPSGSIQNFLITCAGSCQSPLQRSNRASHGSRNRCDIGISLSQAICQHPP